MRIELICACELLLSLNKSLKVTRESGFEEGFRGLVSRIGALVDNFIKTNVQGADSIFKTFYRSILKLKIIKNTEASLAFKLVFAV